MTETNHETQELSPLEMILEYQRNQKTACVILASALLPGLGQAIQKRSYSALWMFLLLALSIFIFVTIGHYGLFFHGYLMIYSSVDAAMNTKGDRHKITKCLTPICVLLLFPALFGATMFPAVFAAREAARRMQCSGQFAYVSLAIHSYHDAHGCFPPAYTVDENEKPLHSWRVLILPYIDDQSKIYDKIRLDEPWDSEHNSQFHDKMSSMFSCPSSSEINAQRKELSTLNRKHRCYMSVVVGEQTMFPGVESVTRDDVTDSSSKTIMIVERITPVCWMDPSNEISYETALEGINRNPRGLGSFHNPKYRCSVGFCSGEVKFLPDDVPPEVLKAMLTRNGGETIAKWREESP